MKKLQIGLGLFLWGGSVVKGVQAFLEKEDLLCKSEKCREIAEELLRDRDPLADPCEDPERHVCGGWQDAFQLWEDESNWKKSFSTLNDATRTQVRGILESHTCLGVEGAIRRSRSEQHGEEDGEEDGEKLEKNSKKIDKNSKKNQTKFKQNAEKFEINRAPDDLLQGWDAVPFCVYEKCMDVEEIDQLGGDPLFDLLFSDSGEPGNDLRFLIDTDFASESTSSPPSSVNAVHFETNQATGNSPIIAAQTGNSLSGNSKNFFKENGEKQNSNNARENAQEESNNGTPLDGKLLSQRLRDIYIRTNKLYFLGVSVGLNYLEKDARHTFWVYAYGLGLPYHYYSSQHRNLQTQYVTHLANLFDIFEASLRQYGSTNRELNPEKMEKESEKMKRKSEKMEKESEKMKRKSEKMENRSEKIAENSEKMKQKLDEIEETKMEEKSGKIPKNSKNFPHISEKHTRRTAPGSLYDVYLESSSYRNITSTITRAENILEFERRMRENLLSPEESRDVRKYTNGLSFGDLKGSASFLDISFLLAPLISVVNEGTPLKVSDETIFLVEEYDFLHRLESLLTTTKAEVVYDYLLMSVIKSHSGRLGGAFRLEKERYTSERTGAETAVRWKQCWTSPPQWTVARIYIAQDLNYHRANRDTTKKLIARLREAFRTMLNEYEWIDEETRKKAQTKLDFLGEKIGYPDWLENGWKEIFAQYYGDEQKALENINKSYFSAGIHFARENNRHNLNKFGKQKDKKEWYNTPHAVNAYYSPTSAEIAFMSAILQPPAVYSCNPESSRVECTVLQALTYGAIGAIIGHEITHAFDDTGKNYDEFGQLQNWWQKSTETEFARKAQCVINQYSAYYLDLPLSAKTDKKTEQMADQMAENNETMAEKSEKPAENSEKMADKIENKIEKQSDANMRNSVKEMMKKAKENAKNAIKSGTKNSSRLYVRGELTVGENIADKGGLTMAYRGLQLVLSEEELNARPLTLFGAALSVKQLFAYSWAHFWCSKDRPEHLRKIIESDPHSPARFRILGPLASFDVYTDSYQCASQSFLLSQPRCKVW